MKRALSKTILALLWIFGACIAVAWGRSHVVGEVWRSVRRDDRGTSFAHQQREINIGGGGIGFFLRSIHTADPDRISWIRWRLQEPSNPYPTGYTRTDDPHYPPRIGGSDQWLAPLGVSTMWTHRTGRVDRSDFALTLPFWLLLLLVWAYPGARYVSGVVDRQRAERLALGMCPRCDCDVRGCVRCPSCGKRMPAEAEPIAA